MESKKSSLLTNPKSTARARLSVRKSALSFLSVINPWPSFLKGR